MTLDQYMSFRTNVRNLICHSERREESIKISFELTKAKFPNNHYLSGPNQTSKMKNTLVAAALLVAFTTTFTVNAQKINFPQRYETWKAAEKGQFKWNQEALDKAVEYANVNEYSGSRDLRIAILEGFKHEPFHQILGPTKKRDGPAGMIMKNGYVLASWGDTQRVDMTFSVTKSFLSTVAGLAEDQGLINDTKDKVRDYIWDGTFDGAHNSKITWEHLLQQNSDWSGELWGGKDWADRPPSEGGLDDWKF